jgi:hypothetical protein
MTKALERRIARLETLVPNTAEVDRANRIVLAFHRVRHQPELATDEDREILATEDWQRAFWISIQAAGGLAAVVEAVEERIKARKVEKHTGILES